ncbi:type II 3-dehydroquinate dehydratase [Cetobacterium sp.]|uniref:type II 3-dehydroquinate dehydratase n=1 Tax=Cetobacterium sp. TaxID=2071632 RepID=UPI002FC856EF
MRDAILSTNLKTIEVHLSNVYSREEFRHKSVISDICIGKITGFGSEGYKMALQYLSNLKK